MGAWGSTCRARLKLDELATRVNIQDVYDALAYRREGSVARDVIALWATLEPKGVSPRAA